MPKNNESNLSCVVGPKECSIGSLTAEIHFPLSLVSTRRCIEETNSKDLFTRGEEYPSIRVTVAYTHFPFVVFTR